MSAMGYNDFNGAERKAENMKILVIGGSYFYGRGHADGEGAWGDGGEQRDISDGRIWREANYRGQKRRSRVGRMQRRLWCDCGFLRIRKRGYCKSSGAFWGKRETVYFYQHGGCLWARDEGQEGRICAAGKKGICRRGRGLYCGKGGFGAGTGGRMQEKEDSRYRS